MAPNPIPDPSPCSAPLPIPAPLPAPLPTQPAGPATLEQKLQAQLDARQARSTLRSLTVADPALADFSSNDFLGLARSPALRAAFLAELGRLSPDGTASAEPASTTAGQLAFPLGSRGSRLLDGNSGYAAETEGRLARFHRAPAALVCNSGFDANAAIFAALPQPGDAVLYDSLIHASVREGLRLSRAGPAAGPAAAAAAAFAHNDPAALAAGLDTLARANPAVRAGAATVFVALEAVYSMDGSVCRLREMVEAVRDRLPAGNGRIILDEAHATGLFGPRGAGLAAAEALESDLFVRVHTFGKALAGNGAVILSSDLVRSYLINYGRPLIYSTFMSFPSLALVRASYSLLESGATTELATRLAATTHYLHCRLNGLISRFPGLVAPFARPADAPGLFAGPHPPVLLVPAQTDRPGRPAPILPLLTPLPRELAAVCVARGCLVRPVVAPTVPAGTERVRVCLNANLTEDDADVLVDAVASWLEAIADARLTARAGSKL